MTTAILSPILFLPDKQNGYHANGELYIGQNLNTVLSYVEHALIVLPSYSEHIFYLGAHHNLILRSIKNHISGTIQILTCGCNQKAITNNVHELGIDCTIRKIECNEDIEILFNLANGILMRNNSV